MNSSVNVILLPQAGAGGGGAEGVREDADFFRAASALSSRSSLT